MMADPEYDYDQDDLHVPPHCVDCGSEQEWDDETAKWICLGCFPQEDEDELIQ